MADPTTKPAGRASPTTTSGGSGGGSRGSAGGRSRMQVAGKLTALVGLPSLIIFSIFGSGVYCGARSADRIVELEQRWLGIEPPPGRLVGTGVAADEPSTSEPEPSTEPEPAETAPTEPKPTQPKPDPDATKPVDPNPSGLAVAGADPVGPELRARFEERRVVRVQLLVDPAFVVGREDWFGYVAGLFESTRASFQVLFGIELQLYGVLVWDSAVATSTAELLGDLRGRERYGADVMLGLIAREQPAEFVPPSWTADVTGDHALIFADLSGADRYYRNTLRALAGLFGAEPALDPAWQQLGNFMSQVSPSTAAAPIIDPENRGKVIINKRRPIAKPATEPALELSPEPGEPGEPDSEGAI